MEIHNFLNGTNGTVIALSGSDYEGLKGSFVEILTENNGETGENFKIAIVVDFEEPEYSSVEVTHPHLNGTSINQLIFADEAIEDLGFYKDECTEFAYHLNGKRICPSCNAPMDSVIELQYDDISWYWNEQEQYYEKMSVGGSEGKKCGSCNVYIEDQNENFSY